MQLFPVSVFLVMELGISEEFVKVVLAMREQRRLDMLAWVLLWMSPGIGDYVTDILGDLTSERHVEEGDGSALGAREAGPDDTDEEASGLIALLLFLETLPNLPLSLPDESEASAKDPTDGTGSDSRRSGGQADLGKRTHAAKWESTDA
jgi:hypothetical protein